MTFTKRVGNRIIEMFDREGRQSKKIAEFCHYNRDLLVIIADPKTDKMFMSYRDKMVSNQIKNAEGKDMKVIKGVLSNSLFKKQIDNFLVSIMDSMQLSLENGNQFYQWIDGALFNIAKALRIKRKNRKSNNQATGSVRVGVPQGHDTPVA